MRVLVCGGRDFGKAKLEMQFVYRKLFELFEDVFVDDITIIEGDAVGVDRCAGEFAHDYGFKLEVFPADWKTHGKAAGYIRNTQMLVEGKPDLVIAFPGGRGTANMVDIAKKAGVEVIEVEYNNDAA